MKSKLYLFVSYVFFMLMAHQSFSQANTSLSNLASATAINHSLVAGSNNSLSLGSSTIGWRNLYLTNAIYLNGNSIFSMPLKTGIAIGAKAQYLNTTTAYLIAIGDSAFYSNTTGARGTAVGSFALYKNTTGDNNTTLGYQTLYNTTTGSSNVATGMQALYSNTSGSNNIADGAKALYTNTTGYSNVAIGIKALYTNISGSHSVAVGDSALYKNTGSSNAALGSKALYNITSGHDNTALGYNANVNSSSATNATAIGSNAYAACNNCIVLGSINGTNGATANINVGIGTIAPKASLQINGTKSASLTSGGYLQLGDSAGNNLAMDNNQIQARNNGSINDLYLNKAGGSVYAGDSSTSTSGLTGYGESYGLYGYSPQEIGVYGSGASFGVEAHASNGSGVFATGNVYGVYASASGSSGAGVYGTGSSYGVQGISTNGTGVYGSGETGGDFYGSGGFSISSSNSNTYGFGIYATASGAAGVGVFGKSDQSTGVYGSTGNPAQYAGYFSGDVYTSGTYTSSDVTLKQNITDMHGAMNIISQLKPKYYNFRSDSDYKLMNLPKGKHYGLIAQDVEKVLPGLIKDSKFEAGRTKSLIQMGNLKDSSKQPSTANAKDEVISFKALNYTELIPIMIKGMQEQQQMIVAKNAKADSMQSEIANLQSEVEQLKSMIANLSSASGQQSTIISSASLAQNVPNPFTNTTSISYNIPQASTSAYIILTDKKGVVLKQVNINTKGKGNINVDASTLAAGAYQYSLYVNNKLIDTKQMVAAR